MVANEGNVSQVPKIVWKESDLPQHDLDRFSSASTEASPFFDKYFIDEDAEYLGEVSKL